MDFLEYSNLAGAPRLEGRGCEQGPISCGMMESNETAQSCPYGIQNPVPHRVGNKIQTKNPRCRNQEIPYELNSGSAKIPS